MRCMQGVPPIKFLVLVAGQRCRDVKYAPLYATNKISCPAFVVIGDQVPPYCRAALRMPLTIAFLPYWPIQDPYKEAIDMLPTCLEQSSVYRHSEGEACNVPNIHIYLFFSSSLCCGVSLIQLSWTFH